MHLVQLLLPLFDPDGERFPPEPYARVRRELTERFGGVTAFQRAPAEGLWREDDGTVVHDEVVVYEVMVERLDRAWWAGFRERLRRSFRQEELVVRATPIERI
jgi:hypothetical protein